MKIKDRIIHLLGGYTKSEYTMNNNTKVRRPVYSCERRIETLKAKYSCTRVPADEMINHIEKDLAIQLALKMMAEGFVTYRTNLENDPRTERPEIYATVHVVRPVEDWP